MHTPTAFQLGKFKVIGIVPILMLVFNNIGWGGACNQDKRKLKVSAVKDVASCTGM